MSHYLISFGARAMDHIPDQELPDVSKAAHAVVQQAVNAGVWVFGGGLTSQKASILPLAHHGRCVASHRYPRSSSAPDWRHRARPPRADAADPHAQSATLQDAAAKCSVSSAATWSGACSGSQCEAPSSSVRR
jgi:hypothetical protein